MTHHFNEPLWQQVRKDRLRRKGLIDGPLEFEGRVFISHGPSPDFEFVLDLPEAWLVQKIVVETGVVLMIGDDGTIYARSSHPTTK